MGHKIPAKEEVFEVNYFDMNTFILVNNLADSDVSESEKHHFGLILFLTWN